MVILAHIDHKDPTVGSNIAAILGYTGIIFHYLGSA
jgi:hypothetical protein